MRRRLVTVVAAAAVALIIALLAVVWSLDFIVKGVIERYGTAATKVPVRIDSVGLSLLGGSASINQLTVANPSGFSAPDVFRLAKVRLLVDRGTIRSNPLVINELTIVSPEVHFELHDNGDSNIDVIRRNLMEYTSDTPITPAPGVPEANAATPPRRITREPEDVQRFLIKRLSIEAAQLVIEGRALGGVRRVVTLPNSEETDIGARSGGATGRQVATAIVRALVRDVAATVAAAQVERSLEKHVGGEAGKALGEGVGEAVKGLGRALNKILGERGK